MFSWSDTFISCLPCLKPHSDEHQDQPHNPAINRIPRARPDELQGLLADTADPDAETLSLHSDPGRARRNKKKKRTKQNSNPRRITLFGYNLFGRPIQLPDEDDALYYRANGTTTPTTTITAHSTSTLDSDAAPLDPDTIAALTSNITAAAQASVDLEAQRLKEKEERRQRRRERKRLAESIAPQGIVGDGDVFEGFQGSGGFMAPSLRKDYSPTSNATFPGSDSGSAQEEYGRFVAAPGPSVSQLQDDHDDADLDGGLYAHKRRPGKRSHGGSDSRSRTSTSTADHRPYQVPSNPNNSPAQLQAPSVHPQPGRKKESSRTSVTTGSSTTSQSPSLPSPTSPAFSIVSPSTVEHGQGFFDAEDSVSIPDDVKKPIGDFPTPRLGGDFPITGFRGLTGVGAKRTGDLGAFLAKRGDEDEINGP